ncbi:protein tyrosine phosphatase [Pseudonocardiaceae bacterium YIM PH 21723]|nr:protein tyrosine phosphatase [Pseudonocardiaceae bacterium YIM PH 21723]
MLFPDGSEVHGRGLRHGPLTGPRPDYGLYLAEPRERIGWPHDRLIWPDFWLPKDSASAVRLIRALHERALAGNLVEVACSGGIGRTGTVLSGVAVLSGIPAAEAIAWVRERHHPRAVETPWQRRWIMRHFG